MKIIWRKITDDKFVCNRSKKGKNERTFYVNRRKPVKKKRPEGYYKRPQQPILHIIHQPIIVRFD